METQYFASRVIAEVIAKRLVEPEGPEFVIVNPRRGEGWLDETVMGPARYELLEALRHEDRYGRFRIYTPVTEQGLDIYVHAKIMIVDDRTLRVGSANINNRSMGLDSECDLLVDGTREDVRETIARLRSSLMAEHLGVDPSEVEDCFAQTRSLIETIEQLRGSGRTLIPFEPPKPKVVKRVIARSEALDPEASDELFEPKGRPGLLARLPGVRHLR